VIYAELLLGFLKVGCFSFGGAYGAIPLIRDVVLSYGWLDDEALAYMIAVSESTPGPIMVNLATYVGSSQAGFLGAVLATFAVVFPAFAVILVILAVMNSFLNNRYVQAALRGMKPCIIGIILATGVYMVMDNCFLSAKDAAAQIQALGEIGILAVIGCGYRCVRKKKLSSIMIIILSACIGIVLY